MSSSREEATQPVQWAHFHRLGYFTFAGFRMAAANGGNNMVFHIYQDMVGHWRWYLAAPNGVKVAVGPVGYPRRGDCVLGIKQVREGGAANTVYDNFGPITSVSGAMVA